MATNTWVASAAGLASVGTNWSLGRAPITGDDVVFDATSVNNCSWDIDRSVAVPNSISINTGYTGTVTQGSVDIGIGAGGYNQAAGTFTPNSAYSVYCAGNATEVNSTVTSNLLNLIMTVDGTTVNMLDSNNQSYLRTLDCRANVIFVGSSSKFVQIIKTSAGKTLSIPSGSLHWLGGYAAANTLTNQGTISGAGVFYYYATTYDRTDMVFGTINCPVILQSASSTGNRAITLAGPAQFGSTVNIIANAPYTMTLDTAGYAVTAAGGITIGTRGAVLWRSSIRQCGGSYDSSAASGDDAGTSQLILTGKGAQTIKRLAGVAENEVVSRAGSIPTLAADLTIASRFAHVEAVNKAGYNLTMSKPGEEYTGLQRPLVKMWRKNFLFMPADRDLLADIERVL